jgi:uncharacterized membrane protein
MTAGWQKLIRWTPRVLGIGVALFVGVFALDAFSQQLPLTEALVHFGIHAIPGAVLLAVVALAWQREWIGALVFIGAAVAYALMVPQRLDWIVIVAGPLLLTGLLYATSGAMRFTSSSASARAARASSSE